MSYSKYWNYLSFVSDLANDAFHLRNLISQQGILAEEEIRANTNQHPSFSTEHALYLDALSQFRKDRSTSQSIKTFHDPCGDISLPSHALSLTIFEGKFFGEYTFICPKCLEHVSKPASQRVVDLLIDQANVEFMIDATADITQEEYQNFMNQLKLL